MTGEIRAYPGIIEESRVYGFLVPGAAQHVVMRRRTGTVPVAVLAVPDQRRTVSLRFTLHRIRDKPYPSCPANIRSSR